MYKRKVQRKRNEPNRAASDREFLADGSVRAPAASRCNALEPGQAAAGKKPASFLGLGELGATNVPRRGSKKGDERCEAMPSMV
jgi:hypothetical protein